MNPARRLLRPPAILLLAAAIVLPGCSGKAAWPTVNDSGDIPGAPTASSSPVPRSPREAMDALAWAMNHLSLPRYSELFTEDYLFALAAADSAGSVFRAATLTRDEELTSALHLFVTGTETEPPATRIQLTFDRTFVPQPDSRPGKTYPWHVEVRRNCVLNIDTQATVWRITGGVRFFLVRGDSAAIPPELQAQGFGPDPNRWWIERWEDETLSIADGSATSAHPASSTTWGELKLLYLPACPDRRNEGRAAVVAAE